MATAVTLGSVNLMNPPTCFIEFGGLDLGDFNPGSSERQIKINLFIQGATMAASLDTARLIETQLWQAQRAVGSVGLENITFVVGDGWSGLPDEAPFDAINIAAATGESVPPVLEQQLAEGGRLVAPVGTRSQHLVLTQRTGARLHRTQLEPVRFVPLVRGVKG